MGIMDKFKGLWGSTASSPTERIEPIALTPVDVASPQAGIMDSTDGRSQSLVWARYNGASTFTAGYLGGWHWGTPGSEISRERALVSAINLDLLFSNPIVAALVEGFSVYAVGNGLTLSSRPNYAALGISKEASQELSHAIETAWAAWAGNAFECDASGRHTLHQLATAVYKSYLLTGESVFLLDWKKIAGATTRTKVNLLDSRQLDQSISRVAEGNNGGSILQGVQFDKNGRLEGFWIRPFVLGNISTSPQAIFVKARTSWGRTRVGHVFDLIAAGQIRGVSPLAAALTPAHSKSTLREFALAQALVQSMVATTVESDLDRNTALKSLMADDPLGGNAPAGVSPDDWAAARAAYYEAVKINLTPGVVTHMMKGDKLVMHRTQSPNSTYDAFDKSLSREAAKAAGSSAEDVSGDYSQTSFSASRLAQELPWRINKRRRAAIVEPFYKAAFTAWLEEACETGRIKLPKGAPAFWEASDAYSAAVWRGEGKPVADPLKAAQADILEVENGLSTLEAKLGERGLDFEEVVAQRKAEREQLEAAGLPYPLPKNRDDFTAEDDASQKD
ncbi:phage portal protein [Bradyrhizobium sp. Arg237L]|uniref:phage portal protein n=1 Tax=Bradyrhizobium sp. Arg237L TaxID=3003352 RepID=UPI00249ED120|nr:phage portal protein [Bradyrhizobium sp. Arg237L]MDI4236800.1 phage portal protein [Bradyrhizobium sp. Arg237L]